MGGIATGYIFNTLIDVPPIVDFFVPILVGVVSACLLRSWWAMLIIPVAFSVGAFLGFALTIGGFDQMNIGTSGFFEGAVFVGILGILPVEVIVAIGIPLGKKIEQRLHQ